MRAFLLALSLSFAVSGCAASRLAGYALFPDAPEASDGEVLRFAELKAPVAVTQSNDGFWHIHAQNEHDAMFVTGYLQARDRLAQMDLFRHLALGRISELVGRVAFGDKSSVDTDRFNRFMDFSGQGMKLWRATSNEERAAALAFGAGVNAFIAEGKLPLEHRLLGITAIEPWQAHDSLAIYQMLMFGLSSNYNREVRRLLMACDAGIDAAERIWPSNIDFGEYALPDEALGTARYPRPLDVVPEMRDELPALCREAAGAAAQTASLPAAPATVATWIDALQHGWSASNNWVVAGSRTASGKPILSNDPHLPHMNPPIVWGVEQATPEYRAVGFVIPGVHRVVFGHNGFIAWGATTNHVDRQDLVVHKPAGAEAYWLDGAATWFTVRTERITVKGEDEPVVVTARFTVDGPLVNDLETGLPRAIPLAALRMAGQGAALDIEAARGISYARSATDFVTAIRKMEGGCNNWVYADVYGTIGYESPCVLPIRDGYTGAFPIPGWTSRYHWKGMVDKAAMPAVQNPRRGWIITANARTVPVERFFTAYNNDPAEPNRYKQAVARLTAGDKKLTPAEAADVQMDVHESYWPVVRAVIDAPLCVGARGEDGVHEAARAALCGWNGDMTSDSVGATIYVALTHALLDRALADELSDGAEGALWRYVLALPQFEANVTWLWSRPATDAAWNDVRTPAAETRDGQVAAAFDDAVADLQARYGGDAADWRWGDIRPFRARHLFAGNDGLLGSLLNTDEIPGAGSPSTLFKNQFHRGDRQRLRSAVGPSLRFTVDMADPWGATYSLAGGQSGWPRSRHFGDLTPDWHAGKGRLFTSGAGGIRLQFVPANETKESQ